MFCPRVLWTSALSQPFFCAVIFFFQFKLFADTNFKSTSKNRRKYACRLSAVTLRDQAGILHVDVRCSRCKTSLASLRAQNPTYDSSCKSPTLARALTTRVCLFVVIALASSHGVAVKQVFVPSVLRVYVHSIPLALFSRSAPLLCAQLYADGHRPPFFTIIFFF